MNEDSTAALLEKPPAPAEPTAARPAPPPGFATSLRVLPRAFWVKWAGTLLNRFGTFVLPFLTLYMTGRGFTEHQAGWALGAISAGSLAAALTGGWMADRVGRRETMALSLIGGAASLLCLGWAESLPFILFWCFMHGALADVMNPAGHAMVADLVPQEHRLAAYSADRLAVNLGFTLGPIVAGFVIEKSFWALFWADAACSVAYAVIAMIWLPRTAASVRERPKQSAASLARDIFRCRPLVSYFAALLLIAIVFRQFNGALPLQLTAAGSRPRDIGLVYMINGLLIVLAELPLTHLTRHWPLRAAIARGAVIIGAGFSLNAFGVSTSLVVASMTVLTIGEMLAFSRTGTYLASLSPDDRRGAYAGVNSLVWCVGGIVGATAGLALYEIAPAAMWALCGVLGIAAALILRSSR